VRRTNIIRKKPISVAATNEEPEDEHDRRERLDGEDREHEALFAVQARRDLGIATLALSSLDQPGVREVLNGARGNRNQPENCGSDDGEDGGEKGFQSG